MAGKLPPETENPVPAIESELIVTAAVPLEVTVTDFVTAVPTATLPKASEVALSVSAGVVAFSCSETDLEVLPDVAVRATDWALLTEAAFAVNVALVAVAGTVIELGTVTTLLLLERLTLWPPVGAAELSEMVHVVVPAPVNELVPHENALIEGNSVDADPLRLIDVDFETDPCAAVNVTVWDDATPDTFAAKLALVAPEGTDTETGTVTALLLLARLTAMPVLGAGALNVTVHVSVPAPIIDEAAQLSPVSEASPDTDPLPCSFTALVVLDD